MSALVLFRILALWLVSWIAAIGTGVLQYSGFGGLDRFGRGMAQVLVGTRFQQLAHLVRVGVLYLPEVAVNAVVGICIALLLRKHGRWWILIYSLMFLFAYQSTRSTPWQWFWYAMKEGSSVSTLVTFAICSLGIAMSPWSGWWLASRVFLHHNSELGFCRRCGYSLKLLVESRCPECGTSFSPEQIGVSDDVEVPQVRLWSSGVTTRLMLRIGALLIALFVSYRASWMWAQQLMCWSLVIVFRVIGFPAHTGVEDKAGSLLSTGGFTCMIDAGCTGITTCVILYPLMWRVDLSAYLNVRRIAALTVAVLMVNWVRVFASIFLQSKGVLGTFAHDWPCEFLRSTVIGVIALPTLLTDLGATRSEKSGA